MALLALKDLLDTKGLLEKRATQDTQGHQDHLVIRDILDLQVTNQDHQGHQDLKVIKENMALQVMNQVHQGHQDQRATKEIMVHQVMNQDQRENLVYLDILEEQVSMAHLAIKESLVKMDIQAKKDHVETPDHLVHLVPLAHMDMAYVVFMAQQEMDLLVILSLICFHVLSTGLMQMVLDAIGLKIETQR